MNKNIKLSTIESVKLGLVALICLFAVYFVFSLSKKNAEINETNYLIEKLKKVVARNFFDNDLLKTKTKINDNFYYQACLKGKPTFQIIESKTNQGYSGEIKLLISIDNESIHKVVPLFHRETPGIGDQIETKKSNWLQKFELNINKYKNIKLKKDGGIIDAISGATVTSRAVTNLLSKEIFEKKHINKISCD